MRGERGQTLGAAVPTEDGCNSSEGGVPLKPCRAPVWFPSRRCGFGECGVEVSHLDVKPTTYVLEA
eukprot:12881554-Prorocentrum_lima.AAC.1